MAKLSRALVALALVTTGLCAPVAARADTTIDCTHAGGVHIGAIIFPPVACRASLDPGTYHLQLSWKLLTTGFVVLDAGDQGTTEVYFNMTVRAGIVTHYQTEAGEASPPPTPKRRGPVVADFTIGDGGGGLTFTVFPEQIAAQGGGTTIPVGEFHLVVTPAAG